MPELSCSSYHKSPGGFPPGSQLNIYEFLRFCVLCFFCRSVSLRSFCSRSFCLRSSRLLGRGFFLAEAEDRASRAFLRTHTAVLTLVVVDRCQVVFHCNSFELTDLLTLHAADTTSCSMPFSSVHPSPWTDMQRQTDSSCPPSG